LHKVSILIYLIGYSHSFTVQFGSAAYVMTLAVISLTLTIIITSSQQ